MRLISLKKCLSNPNHLIKLVVVIGCICFSVYQVGNFIEKLVTPPITTYYSFHLNESLSYPSVTICKQPSFKTQYFPKYGLRSSQKLLSSHFFRNFSFDKYTIKDFLNETTYSFEEVIGSHAYNGLGGNLAAVKWKSFESINHGKCFSFTPMEQSSTYSISGGFWFYLKHMQSSPINSNGVSYYGFHIFVHNDNDIMTSEDEQDNSFLDYFYLEADEDIRLQLKYQEFYLVHTYENPCIETHVDSTYSRSKCLERCLHYQIANQTNCTLPWLWLLPDDWLPQCNTSEQVSLLVSFFLNHNRRRLVANCSCPRSCHVILYTPTIIRRKDIIDKLPNDPYSFIAMYYANNLVTQMKENIGYNINAFVSDIGGSLGFLLGLSVIGLIRVLEKIVCQLVRTYYKKKKPEDGRMSETHSDVVSNSSRSTRVLDDDSSRKYSAAKLNLYENLRDFESDDFKYYQRTLVAESSNRF